MGKDPTWWVKGYLGKAYEKQRDETPLKMLREYFPGNWDFVRGNRRADNEALDKVLFNGTVVWHSRCLPDIEHRTGDQPETD